MLKRSTSNGTHSGVKVILAQTQTVKFLMLRFRVATRTQKAALNVAAFLAIRFDRLIADFGLQVVQFRFEFAHRVGISRVVINAV